MKRKTNCLRVAFALLVSGLLGACSPLESASTKTSGPIDPWIAKHLNNDEVLLCQREVDGEFFFIAKGAQSNKVKIGTRIDVTGAKTPLTSIVAWRFQNEKDDYLTTKTPPTSVIGEYVKDDGKMYSEDIAYQTLTLSGSNKMRAAVDIKKCPTANCERQQTKGKDEKQYTIKLCEVPLNKL